MNNKAAEIMLRKIDAMRKLGMTDKQIAAEMEEVALSERDIRSLLNGEVPALRFSND